jgi:hypothetical protein
MKTLMLLWDLLNPILEAGPRNMLLTLWGGPATAQVKYCLSILVPKYRE